MASWYDGPERVLYVVVGVVLLLTVMWVVDKLFCLGRTLAAAVRCTIHLLCCWRLCLRHDTVVMELECV